MTKYIQATSQWPTTTEPSLLAGLYTSVFVDRKCDQVGCPRGKDDIPRNYDAEGYSWFTRLFFGTRRKTLTAVANLEINSQTGKLSIPVPLFSITHSSVRDEGETFSTNFAESRVGSPLFLIGTTTSVAVGFASGVSDKAESQIAAQALGKVIELVSLVDPKAQIVTDLSKPAVEKASRAIDNAISGLVNKNIEERIDLVNFTDSWRKASSFEAEASVPWIYENQKMDLKVASWRVALRCPRPSAFSERNVCGKAIDPDEAANDSSGIATNSAGAGDDLKVVKLQVQIASDTRLNPATILNTILTGDTTIKKFIGTASWHDSYIKRTERKAEDHVDFCKNLRAAITGIGFNDFDSALVLRAAVDSMPSLARFEEHLRKACGPDAEKWGVSLQEKKSPPASQPEPKTEGVS